MGSFQTMDNFFLTPVSNSIKVYHMKTRDLASK
nr:MAG TPA: hypothetical protein [Caudoviricetes sp.]